MTSASASAWMDPAAIGAARTTFASSGNKHENCACKGALPRLASLFGMILSIAITSIRGQLVRSHATPAGPSGVMRRETLTGPFTRTAGVLTALLAVSLFAPGVVRGDCSSHVTYRSASGLLVPLPELLIGLNAAAPRPSVPVPSPARPCTGPSCSKAPAAPAAPAVSGERLAQSWALLEGAVPPPGRSWTLARPRSDQAHPIDSRDPIFHPPRASRPTRPTFG